MSDSDSHQDVELVPPGMSLRIDVTAFAGASCWLYRSRNMHELRHPELVLALGRREDDDARGLMKDPLELMKVLFERAQSGHRLAVGDWTELSGGLFGRDDLRGLTYLPCPPLPPLPEVDGWNASDAIVVCVLTGDELEVVKRAGAMRIAARLGQTHAYFPYPPWLDRGRADVSVAGEASQTLLSKVARVGLGHATKIGETIVLSLDSRAADRVDQLAEAGDDAAVALLTLPAPDATALLVWRPGQDLPSAYAGPGGDLARLGGGFCLIVGGQEHDEGQLLEDGFAARLTPDSWLRLRHAVRDRAALDIAPGAGLGLSLRWSGL